MTPLGTPKPIPLLWDEHKCQNAVYVHCQMKNHIIVVPNSRLFAWEADVVSVNKSGFIHEYEIKINRSDFKADEKKTRTRFLQDPFERVMSGKAYPVSRPNYFYYAVPTGLVTAEEVPEYAGLIYLEKQVVTHRLYYGTVIEVKKPRRLHSDKITDKQTRQLECALMFRYWRLRLNGRDGKPERLLVGKVNGDG